MIRKKIRIEVHTTGLTVVPGWHQSALLHSVSHFYLDVNYR